MYIWRGKNRRDRREQLTGGVFFWGPPKGTENKIADDEILRQEFEDKHVFTFQQRNRKLIFNFLNTKQGQYEIGLVADEMDRLNTEKLKATKLEAGEKLIDENGQEIVIEAVPEEMKKRATIYEIFRKFDEDGSDSIDRNELRTLLDELRVPMTDDELVVLVNRLDTDGGGEIDFEEFYAWFVSEADAQKSKNKIATAKMFITGVIGRLGLAKKDDENGIYKGFKRMVLEVEARNIIIDYSVHTAVECVRKEFRIAHPPLFLCSKPHCGCSFATLKELKEHQKDVPLHRAKDLERLRNQQKFLPSVNVLQGIHGRQLNASRLLFSDELGALEGRVLAAIAAPFRPHLSDPDALREKQLRDGILVMGADPSSGIRPQHRTKGLLKQYRAPGTKKPGVDQLKDVIIELSHCRDDKIDVFICPNTSTHIEIAFEWKGWSTGRIFLIGEFNGWQPEEMFPNPRLPKGKNTVFKMLSPGKYRYRFVIDGQEVCDSEASIEEPYPGSAWKVPSNVLLVINPTARDKDVTKKSARSELSRAERSGISESESKEESELVNFDTPGYRLFGGQNLSHINLRNACVFDDGAWTLSSFMCRNSFVKVLDLSHNLISDEGMQAIANGLRNFVGLESLKLSGNGFGYDGCRYLRQTFQHSSTLTCLELTNNRIGDDGAEILSGMLTHHLSIKELYLDSCLIGDYGVEKLGEALESNRVIQKLMLSNNRITKVGIQRLMKYVQLNGMLKELSLKYNDIGSEGVRLIGEMLLMNDSIRKLDLSHTNMFSGRSAMGIHAIGTALRTKNKGLQELVMVGNNLRDDCILEFAYSLYFNRGLLVCDLRGNFISENWLKPDTYLLTKLMDQLPSIQTSLDRNAILRQDPELAEKYDVKPRPMEDETEGRWTVRRRWRKLNKKDEKELQEARENSEEQERINAEEEYVASHLSESMNTLEKFLISLEGHNFLKAIAKVVSQYIKALAEGAEATLAENMKKKASGALAAKAAIDALAKDAESSKARVVLSNIVARKEEAERKVRQAAEEERAKKALEFALQQQDLAKKKHEELSSNWEARSHLGIVSSIFLKHGCDENFFIAPEKLDRIFLSLCLPLKEEDAVVALNKTVVTGKNMIGLMKFVKHLKTESFALARTNKMMRYRVLMDIYLKPPLDEAKNIVLQYTRAEEMRRIMLEYRALPGKAPKHLCQFCGRRFVNDKQILRHQKKISHHLRYIQKQDIFASLTFILRRAKYFMTGTYFPCFYELAPVSTLPDNYIPQIFDSRGIEGRPIGVVEPDRTVRVEDSFGYWVKIRFEDRFGWVLFRTHFRDLLIPACQEISKRFWDNMDIWERPRYYRLVSSLPENVQIKVRYMPKMDSEVCGYLTKHSVVECGAVVDNWIQIKYGSLECVWALLISPNGTNVLEPLHPILQNRLQYLMVKSPCMLTEEQLKITEEELAVFGAEEEHEAFYDDEDVIGKGSNELDEQQHK